MKPPNTKPVKGKKPKKPAKRATLTIRLTQDQLRRIKNAAKNAGLSVSAWVRINTLIMDVTPNPPAHRR